MRKCIDLDNQPGFQNIKSPPLQQAIDKGLSNINWGYDKKKGSKKKQPSRAQLY